MRKTRFAFLILAGCLLACLSNECYAQDVAIKTNLFYGAYARTPNLGLEVGLGKRSTLEFGGGYNWFNPNQSTSNKKLVHWIGQVEYRRWFCERFSGHFIGIHAIGTQYNIAGHNLPLIFGKGSDQYRYEGWGAGAGISYGYQFYLGKHWSLEANIGAGYVYLDYDRYLCPQCGRKIGAESRNYFGITRAGISIVYIIK